MALRDREVERAKLLEAHLVEVEPAIGDRCGAGPPRLGAAGLGRRASAGAPRLNAVDATGWAGRGREPARGWAALAGGRWDAVWALEAHPGSANSASLKSPAIRAMIAAKRSPAFASACLWVAAESHRRELSSLWSKTFRSAWSCSRQLGPHGLAQSATPNSSASAARRQGRSRCRSASAGSDNRAAGASPSSPGIWPHTACVRAPGAAPEPQATRGVPPAAERLASWRERQDPCAPTVRWRRVSVWESLRSAGSRDWLHDQ